MKNTVWSGGSRQIHVQEVGTRDGLQVEPQFVPTSDKIELINALSAAGLSKIEVTAFVSPKAIPALRDAEVVLREIERRPGTAYSALVPNVRGAERAIESKVDELNFVMSASESHNLTNLRMTQGQSFSRCREVSALAKAGNVSLNVSLSCSFGCPMEGNVPMQAVQDWCSRLIHGIGVQGVTFCDTTGMAYPTQVYELTRAFRSQFPDTALTLHFHNTRGMGLANILAAIDAGADQFDASLGGIGGCPYAPGATGNVCTEEIVHALEWMGFATGIDLRQVVSAAARLPELIGHDVPSQILKAGERLDLHSLPVDFSEIRQRALARSSED